MARAVVLVALVLCVQCLCLEGQVGGGGGGGGFLLRDSKYVVKTEAGEMRVVRGIGGPFLKSPMHFGFINMEPRSLFIPLYIDSSLILFLNRGEATVGHVYKNQFVEKNLTEGDIYRIGAGSTFYLINTAQAQRLQIICSIATKHNLGEDLGSDWLPFHSFFIGGGLYPSSLLSGFPLSTLSTALNVSEGEAAELVTTYKNGAIVLLPDSRLPPTQWSKFLYNTTPDFQNDHGRSIEVDESDYPVLRHDNIGVFFVYLNAGSMMAPHINPEAIECAVVLEGTGTIQAVYPNGSLALNIQVHLGDIFCVPRFFAFCQIASRTGPFAFVGFTSSSHSSNPQFLIGANSIFQKMRRSVLRASLGLLDEGKVDRIFTAQNQSTILASPEVAPPDELSPMRSKKKEMVEVIGRLSNEMMMGFD